jgi:predicted nucleotidyltransferase component of viral defense system
VFAILIEESFSILKREFKDFSVQSSWFSGNAEINTFHFNELIGTKLRALYQRSKGRDVFDLWPALKHNDLDTQVAVVEHVSKER